MLRSPGRRFGLTIVAVSTALTIGVFSNPFVHSAMLDQPGLDQADAEELDTADESDLVENAVAEVQLALGRARIANAIDEYTFEAWVFGDHSRKSPRDKLEVILAAQIAKTCDVYGLDQFERRKLELAGRGDILHFLTQVDTLRQRACYQSLDGHTAMEVRNEALRLRKLYNEMPYRAASSLYAKVLTRVLDQRGIDPKLIQFIDDPAALEAAADVDYYKSLVEFLDKRLAPQSPLRDKKQRIQLAEMLRIQLQTGPMVSLKEHRLVLQNWLQCLSGLGRLCWMKHNGRRFKPHFRKWRLHK